jgi:putative transposase
MSAAPDPAASPRRKPLGHTPPDFVPSGVIFFLTLCARPRGATIFTTDAIWAQLVHSADFYQQRGRWNVRLLLAMPDHLHLLVLFPPHERMETVVAAWKHYLTRQQKIPWQRDFFDHRPRTLAQLEEKEIYIRENPVRAGLIAPSAPWPYLWPR